MELRHDKLLKLIIEQYIISAKPVGSKSLAEDSGFDLSSATIRNEMADLEDLGFITQPHTSAGRIPTASGYRYYLDNLLSIQNSSAKDIDELEKAYKSDIRDLVKTLSDKTNLATILSIESNNIYITGLFNLFSQPEFEDYKMVLSMGQVVDSLERAIANMFYKIDKPQVLLGAENPWSEHCSVVIAPLNTREKSLLAFLGPLRMDYNQALGLMDSVTKIIK
jgi:transcriptional regulator of heat shock response